MSSANKSKSGKDKADKVVVNKKPCGKCIHFTSGISFGYEWKDCKKNWSDKNNGMFYGVIKDTCDNHHFRKEEA
jgi:frataxin-like iron-binding protein CyaY